MKTLLNRTLFVIIAISVIGILMYYISVWNQEKVFNKYGFDFNTKRKEIGLKEILYILGIIAFIIHLYDFGLGNEEYKILPIIAYSSMTIFFLRLGLVQRREKSK